MFPRSYFAAHYFAPRYFPPTGMFTPVTPSDINYVIMQGTVFSRMGCK